MATQTGMTSAPPIAIRNIPLAQLRESPRNARKHFDPVQLKELRESIAAQGILTPLLVRPAPGNIPGAEMEQYEILAGARRVRAAKLAGLAAAPCVVRDADDALALEIMTIENLQREDLSELEEAQGFKALLDLGRYDVAALAKRVGKSASYVYQRVKLVELAPEAQKALADRKISAGHAILIARLQPRDQKRALAESVPDRYGGALSVRELGDWIQEEIHLDVTKAPWKLDDANLLPPAGACNSCPKRQKNACEDPGCYQAKMEAHIATVSQDAGLMVKISAHWGELKDGVYGMYAWRRGKPGSCDAIATGLPVDSGYAMDGEIHRGQAIAVCINKKCKVHFKTEKESSSSPRQRPAAERVRERKRRTLEAARIEALRQIVATTKQADIEAVAARLCERSTYDSQKLACKALGIWPKDGKTGGFEFRKKLAARVAEAKSGSVAMAQVLTALALAPSFGRWGNGYYDGEAEIAALHAAGKAADVNVAKIERSFLATAAAKQKPKAASAPKAGAAKSHASAKAARPGAGRKRKAANSEGAR